MASERCFLVELKRKYAGNVYVRSGVLCYCQFRVTFRSVVLTFVVNVHN